MRRAILALTGMVAGTTLLISVKSAPGASRLPDQVAADAAAARKAAALTSASAAPGSSLPPGGVVVPGPGRSGSPSAGVKAPGSVSPEPGRTATPPATGTPKATATTKPPATPTKAGNFTGDSAYTEFGYVTVAITVSGGKITAVTAVELPSNEPRSVSISAKAEPVLRQRALAAQSSTIDSVSGATYTSAAYKTSLQSALDKAGRG